MRKDERIHRQNKERYYSDIAIDVAKRSTCLHYNCGAVIVNNDEIISTGYNDAPKGCNDCISCGCLRDNLKIPKGSHHEICRSVHAEVNAIISASKKDMIGATLYLVSLDANDNTKLHDADCCLTCKKMIINAGIEKIVCLKDNGNLLILTRDDFIRDIDHIYDGYKDDMIFGKINLSTRMSDVMLRHFEDDIDIVNDNSDTSISDLLELINNDVPTCLNSTISHFISTNWPNLKLIYERYVLEFKPTSDCWLYLKDDDYNNICAIYIYDSSQDNADEIIKHNISIGAIENNCKVIKFRDNTAQMQTGHHREAVLNDLIDIIVDKFIDNYFIVDHNGDRFELKRVLCKFFYTYINKIKE